MHYAVRALEVPLDQIKEVMRSDHQDIYCLEQVSSDGVFLVSRCREISFTAVMRWPTLQNSGSKPSPGLRCVWRPPLWNLSLLSSLGALLMLSRGRAGAGAAVAAAGGWGAGCCVVYSLNIWSRGTCFSTVPCPQYFTLRGPPRFFIYFFFDAFKIFRTLSFTAAVKRRRMSTWMGLEPRHCWFQ